MPFGIESHAWLGPSAAASLELMREHVKSIKQEALVPLKIRCMVVLPVGLLKAQVLRLLHASPRRSSEWSTYARPVYYSRVRLRVLYWGK